MSDLNQFTPNARDAILDTATGQLTEIGRILVRRLSALGADVAPPDAQYLTATSTAGLTNERNLGALASGYLKIVTAAGIAVPSSVAAIPLADVATLSAGAYTPTLFNVANLGASTAFSCQYLRVGAVVTVSGRVDVDPTAGATLTTLGISLPIASALANANECAGTGVSPGIAGQCAAVLGDVANARASLQWTSADVTNQALYFSFTYRVI
jgi:hypothetical protein